MLAWLAAAIKSIQLSTCGWQLMLVLARGKLLHDSSAIEEGEHGLSDIGFVDVGLFVWFDR